MRVPIYCDTVSCSNFEQVINEITGIQRSQRELWYKRFDPNDAMNSCPLCGEVGIPGELEDEDEDDLFDTPAKGISVANIEEDDIDGGTESEGNLLAFMKKLGLPDELDLEKELAEIEAFEDEISDDFSFDDDLSDEDVKKDDEDEEEELSDDERLAREIADEFSQYGDEDEEGEEEFE